MIKKMKTGTKILCSLVIVILLCGCYIIGTRNKLVQQEQEAKQVFANVQVYLQRRNDLIPNLVSSVKGYAKHEEAVFNAVTEARQNMINAKTPEETVQADAALSSAVGRLLAVAEAATAQVTCAVIVTAICCPLLVTWLAKKEQKKRAAKA